MERFCNLCVERLLKKVTEFNPPRMAVFISVDLESKTQVPVLIIYSVSLKMPPIAVLNSCDVKVPI